MIQFRTAALAALTVFCLGALAAIQLAGGFDACF